MIFQAKSVISLENVVLVFFAKVAIFHNIINMLFKLSLIAHLYIVKKVLKYLFKNNQIIFSLSIDLYLIDDNLNSEVNLFLNILIIKNS
ncbi:hypothetical protein CRN30_15275 [Vibrio vulnificus]|nr:hypothetical protein CRN30_15275 [Vibrio vulnificus]